MGRDIKIQANLYYLPQCNIVWCFIENTQVSEKVVHHTIQHQKLVLSQTGAILPEVQLSIFTEKCHILFVYLRDSNGVNTGDI